MAMRYFGRKYKAPIYEDIERAETPVGQPCVWCEEPIAEGEDGFYDAGGSVLHQECLLRMIAGSVSHQAGVCSCFGGEDLPCSLSKRAEARAALVHFHWLKRIPEGPDQVGSGSGCFSTGYRRGRL